MADFVVPKNKDYTFTVNVKEKESFLAQDLTNMSTATIEFILLSTGCPVTSEVMTVQDALNGILKCTIPAAKTNLLTVIRGSEVDDYYLKPAHQALITITFTDSTPTVFTVLPKVYATPTGC